MKRSMARCTAGIVLALVLSGCVTYPTADELEAAPSPHLQVDAPLGIQDERAPFRETFCAAVREVNLQSGSSTDCDRWLHRMTDEAAPMVGRTDSRRIPSLQILLVTGAFSECYGEHARPFGAVTGQLAARGHRIDTVVVGGRSGSPHNARQIAEFLEDWSVDPERPLVLIGYSKGTTDILQYLVDFPESAGQVDAVVSVAGSVRGSPLADRYDTLYRLLLSHLPIGECDDGDGKIVESLRTDVRRKWLADNRLPDSVSYYSIAAFTTRDRLARGLVNGWKSLLKFDRRNDGQLLPRDALIPDSALLAYLNADHWSVAMEIEKELEFLGHRESVEPFPLEALLVAIVETVAEDYVDSGVADAVAGGRGHPE